MLWCDEKNWMLHILRLVNTPHESYTNSHNMVNNNVRCTPEKHANGYLNAIKHESKYYYISCIYNYFMHEKYTQPHKNKIIAKWKRIEWHSVEHNITKQAFSDDRTANTLPIHFILYHVAIHNHPIPSHLPILLAKHSKNHIHTFIYTSRTLNAIKLW